MTRNINKKTKEKQHNGFITAYLLVAVATVTTLLAGLLIFVASAQRKSTDEVNRQQALQIAETGIYFYKWYLAHNLDGKNAQQIKDFWDSGSAYGVSSPYEVEVTKKDGTPIGKYQIDVVIPSSNSTIVNVTSAGWTYKHTEIVKSIGVRFRRPSWSEYSVLANDVMRFGSGTNVQGSIHSNNGIRFDGVANNLVSSSVEQYLDPDTGTIKPGVWTSQPDEDAVFLAGKEFPVTAIDFNGVTTDFALIKSEAETSGIYLADETYEGETCGWVWSGWPPPFFDWECSTGDIPVQGYHLTLRTDDKVEIRRVFGYDGSSYQINDESDAQVVDLPSNELIFVENHLWIDGQIDTAYLTIASADLDSGVDTNVYINNDITYTHTDGQEVLGIIAENNISVGLYSEDNLEIDAALLAQKGRIGRDHYWFSSHRWRDEITVYGSLATNQRYGFAWTDGTGYNTRNLYFDNNLLYTPPPFFPTGTEYELDLWEDL